MIGLLAFSSPALAQQNPPPQQNSPPPSHPPFICDPQLNPDGGIACWALVGATLALMGIMIAEGSKEDNKGQEQKPASP